MSALYITYGNAQHGIDVSDVAKTAFRTHSGGILVKTTVVFNHLFGDVAYGVEKHLRFKFGDMSLALPGRRSCDYLIELRDNQLVVTKSVAAGQPIPNVLLQKRRVALYTCVYGAYELSLCDHCVPVEHERYEFDFFCYTDAQSILETSKRWQVIVFEPCPEWCGTSYDGEQQQHDALRIMHNTVLMRSNPHKLRELDGYDACIYVDGNVCINDEATLPTILDGEFAPSKLILSKHAWRSCVYKEAEESRKLHKYYNTDLTQQCWLYREREKMPSAVGLYWNGFIIYIGHKDARFLPFYALYTSELTNYVIDVHKPYHAQGQLSLPFVLWKLGWLSAEGKPSGNMLKIIPCLLHTPQVCATKHGE
jgi:hypothetical protein